MKLLLNRKYPKPDYTIGKLSIDGTFFCDTLEPPVRPVKIKGQTAIPAGTYKVAMSFSNRFKRVLPELLNVPGFEGVRIHGGNTAADTEGCILVGKNNVPGMVTNSQHHLALLLAKLQDEKDIQIEIV